MIKQIFNYLKENNISKKNIDSKNRIDIHETVIKKKKILAGVFRYYHKIFYQKFKNLSLNNYNDGILLELGSGVYPIKRSYPKILSSDIIHSNNLDLVINAENINLPDNSIDALFGQNIFHHISNPYKFFDSSLLKLKKGGIVVLLEPSNSLLSKILHKNMHQSEIYDEKQLNWIRANNGPMTNANQALSTIIFIRDRDIFEKKYPNFEIIEIKNCKKYLHYLFSGGLNFKQLWPDKLAFLLDIFEFILTPLKNLLAVHHIIILRKK
jgi:SAM-dependent methyltransferase